MSKKAHRADDDMKDEYDFSGAVREKYFVKDAQLIGPIHLEPEVQAFLQARATARGKTVSQLVNDLLKKDIELLETIG
jgi:hypothetical protein